MTLRTARRLAAAVALTLSAALAGGCANDHIEFNGKIFEAVGLAGNPWKKEEVRTQPRAPLVLPPDSNRLPEPGSAPPPSFADQSWPKDPQQQKLADAEAKKRAQEQFCKDGNWKEKAHGNEIKAAQGPNGSCQGSIFSVMSKTLLGNNNDD